MAHLPARRRGEIVRTLFEVLADAPNGMAGNEAIARTQDRLILTDYEKSPFPNGSEGPRFPKIVRFATINAVKAGWLSKANGTWSVTQEGLDALQAFPDPEAFFLESGRLYKRWKSAQDAGDIASAADGTDDEASDATLLAGKADEAEENAREEILDYLGDMGPFDFQDLVGHLLRAMGYFVPWTAPPGRDGGLDLIAQADPLGVEGPRIKGQVKRKRDAKTSVEELRAFIALVEDNEVGVYISLGGFTREAEALNRANRTRLTLIDGGQLVAMWIEFFDQIDEEGKQLLPIRAVHYLDRAEL